MSLKIRLRQQGQKNRRMFRLVVIDEKTRRDGRYIESLGHYNPFDATDEGIQVEKGRIEHWVGLGAQPSEGATRIITKRHPEMKSVLCRRAASSKKKSEKK